MLVRHLYRRMVQIPAQQQTFLPDDPQPERTPSHLREVQRHVVQQAENAN